MARATFSIQWLALCAVLVVGLHQVAAQDALTIDATTVIAQVNEYAYGANYGPLSFVSADLFELAANSGVTFLRFPGGRWGDLNDITTDQIDSYIRTAELVGAEPSIHVRLENGTPAAAAALVSYANIEQDYNIRYWYIGNEPNLFDDYTVADHSVQWRAIAEAMLAVDPDIVLIGPDISQWNGTPEVDPVDPDGVDWLRGFLQANGDMVDVVSVHRYPFPRSQANPITTVEELRANSPEWGNTLENLRRVIEEETGRTDLPVAVTEANSHWSAAKFNDASPDSHYNAVWWADSLGRLLEDEPFIVGYFELQTPTRRGAWGLMGTYDPVPTYFVYQFYKEFGTEMVSVSSPEPSLSVYAALRDDGALTLIAVNRADEAVSVPVAIEGYDGDVTETRLLTEEIVGDVVENTLLVDDTLTVPPRAVALIVLGGA